MENIDHKNQMTNCKTWAYQPGNFGISGYNAVSKYLAQVVFVVAQSANSLTYSFPFNYSRS